MTVPAAFFAVSAARKALTLSWRSGESVASFSSRALSSVSASSSLPSVISDWIFSSSEAFSF